jgi:hypothetical protein
VNHRPEKVFVIRLTEPELQRILSALLANEHSHIAMARLAEAEGRQQTAFAHLQTAHHALQLVEKFERIGGTL